MTANGAGKSPQIGFQVGVQDDVDSLSASQELLELVTENVITDFNLNEVSNDRSFFTGKTSVETIKRLFGGEYQLRLDGNWEVIKEPSVPDRLSNWLRYIEVGPLFSVCCAPIEEAFGD